MIFYVLFSITVCFTFLLPYAAVTPAAPTTHCTHLYQPMAGFCYSANTNSGAVLGLVFPPQPPQLFHIGKMIVGSREMGDLDNSGYPGYVLSNFL